MSRPRDGYMTVRTPTAGDIHKDDLVFEAGIGIRYDFAVQIREAKPE